MARRLAGIVAWAMLVLGLGLFAFRIHSASESDHFQCWLSANRCISFGSSRGVIRVNSFTLRDQSRTPVAAVPSWSPFRLSIEDEVAAWRYENNIYSHVEWKHFSFHVSTLIAIVLLWPAIWFLWLDRRRYSASPIETASQPANFTGAPNWETEARHIECPMCSYDLRGLAEPRCPECGYPFVWAELLDPRRQRHPYLFEHARNRPIRAFFKTIARNFEANRFWTTLYPTQPIAGRRLFFYGLICLVLAATPSIAAYIVSANLLGRNLRLTSGFAGQLVTVLNRVDPIPHFSLLMAIYPLATAISLLIFQQSMRRAKMKSGHAWRCAIYSADAIVWNAGWQWGVIVLESFEGTYRTLTIERLFVAGMAITIVVSTIRLASAYRHYMRFSRPLATAVMSQTVVVLLLVTLDTKEFGEILFR